MLSGFVQLLVGPKLIFGKYFEEVEKLMTLRSLEKELRAQR
jgi:hypothetical protein